MRLYVFTHAPVEGLVALAGDLEQGAWKAIDISAYQGGADRTALLPLGDAPTLTTLKFMLHWAIGGVSAARAGAYSARDLDQQWDLPQKRLASAIHGAKLDPDPAKRAAAERLEKGLLLGAGVQQTRLKYQAEVAFGRKQVSLVADGQAHDDLVLLGLEPLMAEIAAATEALATGISHGDSANRPSEKLEEAVSVCAATFSGVAARLALMAEIGQLGEDRDRAAKLLAPLAALVARYPAPPPKAAKGDATPPTGPTQPTGPAQPTGPTGG